MAIKSSCRIHSDTILELSARDDGSGKVVFTFMDLHEGLVIHEPLTVQHLTWMKLAAQKMLRHLNERKDK